MLHYFSIIIYYIQISKMLFLPFLWRGNFSNASYRVFVFSYKYVLHFLLLPCVHVCGVPIYSNPQSKLKIVTDDSVLGY